jgi:hypothetical protein
MSSPSTMEARISMVASFNAGRSGEVHLRALSW